MTDGSDHTYFEEGYAAPPGSKNPYVGRGKTQQAVQWGLGHFAANEECDALKRKEPAQ